MWRTTPVLKSRSKCSTRVKRPAAPSKRRHPRKAFSPHGAQGRRHAGAPPGFAAGTALARQSGPPGRARRSCQGCKSVPRNACGGLCRQERRRQRQGQSRELRHRPISHLHRGAPAHLRKPAAERQITLCRGLAKKVRKVVALGLRYGLFNPCIEGMFAADRRQL